MRNILYALTAFLPFVASGCANFSAPSSGGEIVRIAEIEVYPEWLEDYLSAAGTVGSESVKKEPGVVCIFLLTEVLTAVHAVILLARDRDALKEPRPMLVYAMAACVIYFLFLRRYVGMLML